MKNLVDSHTHTILSGHAHSTISENATAAAKRGLEALVVTDHSMMIPGGAPGYYFAQKDITPKELSGVRVFFGCEANIWAFSGEVDVCADSLRHLDFVIASLHQVVLIPSTVENNTRAVLNALHNPFIDCIGHMENPLFPVDIEPVVHMVKEQNRLIELNTSSFMLGRTDPARLRSVIDLCIAQDVRMCIGSDAHVCPDVGNSSQILDILDQANCPKHLLVTRSRASFEEYLSDREARITAYLQSSPLQIK